MNSQSKRIVMMQKIFNPSQYRLTSGLGTLNRENYVRIMGESLNKALNPDEVPVKEKHVRRLLIASFQFESGQFFWENLSVIRLKEHRIVCWKFCYVLHKLIRDGHKQVLLSCRDRRQILLDCGNLWRHLAEGYGSHIHAYCELLYDRIKFHNEYPDIPNDLKLTNDQLNILNQQDTTGDLFYLMGFDICASIDHTCVLTEKVLNSLENKRINSTSNAGRCHLSPVIACIQDAFLFYDILVRVLSKLHAKLRSNSMLSMQERFDTTHRKMKCTYDRARNLQYLRSIVQIPDLPEEPPNFLTYCELEPHFAPQVVLVAETNERDSPDHGLLVNLDDEDDDKSSLQASELISTTTTDEQTSQRNASDASSSLSNDTLINQSDLSDLLQAAEAKAQAETRELTSKIASLEANILELKLELERERGSHETTRSSLNSQVTKIQAEMSKLRQDLSNMTYQLNNSKNAYEKLSQECQRAKHDNEISQIAMKRMMKEMNELRAKQKDELQQVRHDIGKEADAREEDQLMAEMNEIDKIIKEATRKIEELSEKSRKLESGIKLQVNEKISEVCTNLMKAVRNLIAQARLLQREIVASESKLANQEEFYKRNSSWTEGLISAANVVAMAARSLVDAADRTMSNQARFAELGAAAHEIAAATTQLVVASRVKANKDSEKLKLLTNAAKQVNQCTLNVVEASRVCAELVDQDIDKIDISTLSLHQTKKLEMETQVRLIELEELLTKERAKLGLLRRQHYEQEEAQAAVSTVNSSTSSN